MSRFTLRPMATIRLLALFALLIVVLAACQAPTRPAGATAPPTAYETRRPAPVPVRLPADDAPHHDLTEWWYYTGHLWTDDSRRYGFELVIFQSIRGESPIGYLAHFAVTDLQRGRFAYAAKAEPGRAVPSSLDLDVGGWTIRGGGGDDHLAADMENYAIELTVLEQKPAAMHLGGSISFGPAGDSYYYSRTRTQVAGHLRDGDEWVPVTGQAWFDHQWGDFIVASVSGWDWYSIQLGDNSELMLFTLISPQGERGAVFGTFVDPSGGTLDLTPANTTIEALGWWTSPHTGAVYPSGWRVRAGPDLQMPSLDLQLAPLLVDQELAFEIAYWEGAVQISGTADGAFISGEGYVELTGYRP